MPQGGAKGQNLGHLRFFCLYFSCMESFNLNNMYCLRYFSLTSDRKVQCPRVGLEVKIYQPGVYVPLRALF